MHALETRRGDWIQTFTGRRYWPLDPRPDDVFIEDIAHALAMKCRYGGHCAKFYSVAEHSVYVARAVPEGMRLAALLHDAAEAYVADVPTPVKKHLDGYCHIEDDNEVAIARRFCVEWPWSAEVQEADHRILHDEMAQIMPTVPASIQGIKPLGIEIWCWSPVTAERMFLEAFAKYAR